MGSEQGYASEKPSTRSVAHKEMATSQSPVDLSPVTTASQLEKNGSLPVPDALPSLAGASSDDPEKDDVRAIVCQMNNTTAVAGTIELPVEQGRPDVAALVKEAVGSVGKDKRVLIAACGPDSLMKVVRNTAAGLITKDGPSVELHCEQFGW
jgi:hypothetical protein